jgi:hypothetical protein
MKFDLLSAVIGFLLAFLVMVFKNRFFSRYSHFDVPKFNGLSADAASKLYEKTLEDLSADLKTRSEAAIAAGNPMEAKKIALDMQKTQQDFSLAYNTYMMELTPATAIAPEVPPPPEAPKV